MSIRRTVGWLAMVLTMLPLWLVVYRLADLPLPFVLMMAIGVVAIFLILRAAHQVRAWIDPTFDSPYAFRRPR